MRIMNKTKKLIFTSLFVFVSTWGFLQAQESVINHLNIDFSGYKLGNVKTQKDGAGGAWTGGAAWIGDVVPVTGYVAGTQALQVYKTAGSSAGRGSVPINTSLSLASAGKIYMSVDVYAQTAKGDLELALSNGSFGAVTNLGFGMLFNMASKSVSFNSSTLGVSLTRTKSSLTLVKNTWYRFEFEITQSATPGSGTFSVFASASSDGVRTAILTGQSYKFASTSLPTLNVVPLIIGSATDAVAINNIVLQSGLTDFPVNPLSSTSL